MELAHYSMFAQLLLVFPCVCVDACMIPFVIVLRQLDSHFASTVFVFLLSQWLIEVCSVYCLFVKLWYVCSDIFIHLM